MRRAERGFTIVEFMVATSVFTVVLMGVTAGILHIGRVYQHSLYASNTQSATSNLVDTISQSIKFSAGDVGYSTHASGTQSYCIGNRQFLFVTGRQLDGPGGLTSTKNAVMTRQNSGCVAESIIATTPTNGSPRELLGKGMRLSKLSITPVSPTSPLVNVTVRVIFGDDDLLCSPPNATSDTCTSPTNFSSPDLRCLPDTGSTFCTASELTTTVYRRL